MQVLFLNRTTPQAVLKDETQSADLLLFGFQGGEEVSYEKELKGETGKFEELARLSKARNAVVVCGLVTDMKGLRRKSALVAENGRILGVSDMLNAFDEEWNVGASTRVFETKKGRIGVLVAEDLYFYETAKSLAVAGCDFIVCPFGGDTGENELLMLRANAFTVGLPILFCSRGYSLIVSPFGNVEFASPKPTVSVAFDCPKTYRIMQTRVRGYARLKRTEY